jgi:hypothetical protein
MVFQIKENAWPESADFANRIRPFGRKEMDIDFE